MIKDEILKQFKGRNVVVSGGTGMIPLRFVIRLALTSHRVTLMWPVRTYSCSAAL